MEKVSCKMFCKRKNDKSSSSSNIYILNLLILIFFLFPSGKVSKARQKASGHKLKNKNFKARDYGKAGAIQIIRDTPGVNFTNILRASFEFGAKNYKAVFWL